MRYISVFIALVSVWVAVVAVALARDDTDTTLELYRLLILFTLLIVLIGFRKRGRQ